MKKLLLKAMSVATGLLMLGTLAANAQERTACSLSGPTTVAVGSSIILTSGCAINGFIDAPCYDYVGDPYGPGAHTMNYHASVVLSTSTTITVTGLVAGVCTVRADTNNDQLADLELEITVTADPEAVPQTSLVSTSCGITPAMLSTNLFAKSITGATSYTFKFVNNTTSAEIISTSPYNYINGTKAGCVYGTAYTVFVKATTAAGTGDYKVTGCVVTYAAMPNTQLLSTSCSNIASVKTRLWCKGISGATSYEWRFIGASVPGGTLLKTTSTTWLIPYNVGIIAGPFSVEVRALPGGSFSTLCNVTVGGGAKMNGGSNGEITFNAYPNPSKGELRITTNTYGTYDVINKFGQTVKVITLNEENEGSQDINDLNSGIYYIVNQEDRTISKKVIVEKE